MKIAWIGTGIMGGYMLQNLHQQGHQLHIYNRSYEKAERLKQEHIEVHNTITDCVKDCEVIFTMVGYPKDVEEIYTCRNGIFESATKGSIFVDMTTSSPHLAKKLSQIAYEHSCAMLDAPVSGGDIGAKCGTLSIMVGGDEEAYRKILPLFKSMGKEIQHMGKAGNGQHTKACNQIAVAGAVAAMSEAIHYARVNELCDEDVINVISRGAAGSWQLENTAPKVLHEDYAPGFFIKHFVKDMHIVQDVMKDKNEKLPMLETVCQLYEKLQQKGYENDGTQALIKYYEKR